MLPASLLRYLAKPYPNTFLTIIRRNSTLTESQTRTINRFKYPSRGGQNLTERYRRLEKTLRGKEARSRPIDEDDTLGSPAQTSTQPATRLKRKLVRTFRGFVIPEKPKSPEEDECCMSGCAICVHDLYHESLNDYNESITSLRASLNAVEVPESEWPDDIIAKKNGAENEKKSISLSAFEEMERMLQEKHRREDMQNPEVHAKQVERIDNMATESSSRSKRRKASLWGDIVAVYEGLRWVLFSNR